MLKGFPGSASGKEPTCQYWRHKRYRFYPWVRKIPWRRKWQPTPVFLPGESHRLRRLVGYSPQAHKELDTAEVTWHTHTQKMLKVRWRSETGKGRESVKSALICKFPLWVVGTQSHEDLWESVQNTHFSQSTWRVRKVEYIFINFHCLPQRCRAPLKPDLPPLPAFQQIPVSAEGWFIHQAS